MADNTEQDAQQQTGENFAPPYDTFLKCDAAYVGKQWQNSKITH